MKIKIFVFLSIFIFLSFNSFATDDMHWSPRMYASGAGASLDDLLGMAKAIQNEDHLTYSSYYYYNYNYDSHSEKNVYMNDNTITAIDGVSSSTTNSSTLKPKLQDGGRMSWEWEFK